MTTDPKPSILILEDDATIGGMLSEALSLDGFKVFVCRNVDEFKKLDASESINIYLLDVVVPDGNGFDVARNLRSKYDAGIIMLTGQASEIDVVLGLEIGADDFIPKPFRTREVRARVKSLHRRLEAFNFAQQGIMEQSTVPTEAPAAEETLKFNDWAINTSARSVRHATGFKLELTTSEYNLLVYLIRNSGRVVTRDQILDSIRGQNWASYDRLVDGLISRLRSKFVAVDDDLPIKTIRGVGYIFEG